MVDLPPNLQERVLCSIMAAVKYEVPVNIVLAVAEKEGGKPELWVKNSNGTYDVGSMQFNTAYLRDLKKYGITPEDVAKPGCYSFDLAAWRLREHLRNDKNDLWTRAANYHSRTPKFNALYRSDLKRKATIWAHWLEERFDTYPVVNPGLTPARLIQKESTAPQVTENRIKTQELPGNPQALNALNAFFTANPRRRGFS
ncbi:MAG: transglycosylase SLT domain-containing protein [Tatlockia sp.]|nr:transglycosylase SLT domain-containing protein [Tatlockia sp.]